MSTPTPAPLPRVHVVPLEDQILHFQDGECCTAFLCEDEGIMVHHSADQREQHERQGHQSRPWGVFLHDLMDQRCPVCRGTGVQNASLHGLNECPHCDGTGKVTLPHP